MWLPRIRLTMRAMVLVVAAIAIPLAFVAQAFRQRDVREEDQCRHTLRYIGQALSGYQYHRHRPYPPGALGPTSIPPEQRPGWCTAILVGLDYDVSITRDAHGCPWPNVTWPIHSFRCPVAIRQHDPDPTGLGPTNYVGIAGLGVDAPTLPAGHPRAGVFGYDRQTGLGEITDGLASTMAIAETTREGRYAIGGPDTVRGVDPSQRPYLGPGRPFGGFHRGGAMALFADGSVRMIAESIDPRVFEASSTIAGGEPIGMLPGGTP